MTLLITSLLTKNQVHITSITLIIVGAYTIYLLFKTSEKFKYRFNIIKCIKYNSVEVFNDIMFFIIFLFGLSNALEFGIEYTSAINFIALITDTQWDAFSAITTVAKIDISKKKFNYIEHRNNAYKLLSVLISSILVLFTVFYNFYDLNFRLCAIYLSIELANFIIWPIYNIKTCYLQLEWSAIKTTSNKITTSILRTSISFLKTPFCTVIGQVVSSIYQFVTINIMFGSNFSITKDGKTKRKLKSKE